MVRLQTSSDSVGIGTARPVEKLHVEGTIYISDKATIGPGNMNSGTNAFVVGKGGEASGNYSTVTGGLDNVSSNDGTVVGGGVQNVASGRWATIGGGQYHDATGQQSTVSGGWSNEASGHGATVGGGSTNHASGWMTYIGGGWDNNASDSSATVSGGWENRAGGKRSTVPGGFQNAALGDHSFAAGYRAKANHDGSFIWADQTNADFSSTAANQFLIRTSSGVGINTNSPGAALHIGGTPGTDGIMFPDGSLQTTAASGGTGGGWVDDGTVVRLQTQSDLVGIGTTNPQASLHISPSTAAGTTDASALIAHQKHGSGSGTSHMRGIYGKAETNSWTGTNNMYGVYGEGIANNTNGTAVQNIYGVYGKASGNSNGIQTATGGYFTASGADFNYAAIFDQGYVGIGTTQPTAKLHIDGTPGVDGLKFPDGTLQTTASTAGAGNTLDQAYDQGGPGTGKMITADAGAVNIAGPDGMIVNGNVSIGTSTSTVSKLHLVSPSTQEIFRADVSGDFVVEFRIDGNGNVIIGNTNISNILTVVPASTTDPIADAWTVYSSRRWKTSVKPLERALENVQRLQGVSFNWKTDGTHDIGLIAEDVGEVIPEVVVYEENGIDGKSVDYARLTCVLIEAVKEQQKIIDNQNSAITELQTKIAKVETVIKRLNIDSGPGLSRSNGN